MGSMFPGAGGLYVYLREAYGETVGFLYGWFILFISTSGSIAALAVVCSEHLLVLFGGGKDPGTVTMLAAGITIFLTVVNLFGVKIGEWIANLFTGAKLLGLLLIIGAGVFFASKTVSVENAATNFASTEPVSMWSAFAVAFVGVLWSYGGWQHASYMAGEAVNPQKTVPRAMMIGAAIVTLVYVLANVAYLRMLPVEHMAQSKTIAADAMGALVPWGAPLMAFLIAVSTFGTTGIYCMTAPRIYYAMAKDGIFFPQLAKVHPKWKTPVNAILIQSGWSLALLLFWGTFEDLIEYVTFMDWIGLGLVASTIFVFRKRQPNAERGYRTTAFPLPPLFFLAVVIWFVSFTLVENPVKAAAGLGVVGVGWLAYILFFKKNNQQKP
ncbi:MAG: amino acid permease [Lewinellaceae bacterium]|nr:amino acid permease [Lewinellaceae bacterium]